jgi:hypothetical protein
MKWIRSFNSAAERFGRRFSNLHVRLFAAFLLIVHCLMLWAIPGYTSTFLGALATTLGVLTVFRADPVR